MRSRTELARAPLDERRVPLGADAKVCPPSIPLPGNPSAAL
jgi:hypothetical protein